MNRSRVSERRKPASSTFTCRSRHAHRPHRALEHGVDAGDRARVDDVRRALARARGAVGVEHVALRAEVRMVGELGLESASRCRLSTATISFRSTSSPRERRADEARATSDEMRFPRAPRARLVVGAPRSSPFVSRRGERALRRRGPAPAPSDPARARARPARRRRRPQPGRARAAEADVAEIVDFSDVDGRHRGRAPPRRSTAC